MLDTVLQIAEALSLFDECAAQLASNQKLVSVTCEVICLSFKDEVRTLNCCNFLLFPLLSFIDSFLTMSILDYEVKSL